jgi:hypothetical protein
MAVVRVVFETHSTSEDNERGVSTGWLSGAPLARGTASLELGEGRRTGGVDAVRLDVVGKGPGCGKRPQSVSRVRS